MGDNYITYAMKKILTLFSKVFVAALALTISFGKLIVKNCWVGKAKSNTTFHFLDLFLCRRKMEIILREWIFFALRSLKLPYHFCIRLKSGSTHEPSELGIEAKFTFVYDVAPPFMGFLLILDTIMKFDFLI